MSSRKILLDLKTRSPKARPDRTAPDGRLTLEEIRELAGRPGGPAGLALGIILLKNGYLDEAHDLAQEIGGSDGDALHALMHRMEGDYGNTRYWHARVGRHPTHGQQDVVEAALAAGIPDLVREGVYEPSALTAAIESGNPTFMASAARLHDMEMDALFDWCIQQEDQEET